KDDRVVTSGILNWTSWMSNETSFGYAPAGPYSMINKALYDKISDTDFRKLAWKAPAGSKLSGKEQTPLAEKAFAKLPAYASLKFKPSQGNTGESAIACSGDYPLMRVEEMYLIEAEATAHSNPAAGMALLADFMKYRDTNYDAQAAVASHANDKDVLAGRITAEIAEIIQQKRVELWGEGLIFHDLKRLNMSCTRYYTGTNFATGTLYNTEGRPAWMNWVMVQSEGNSNVGVRGWNNPSFEGVYTSH
ncbi:MAG: RagB/SusD family nutrient uptake outer membrane protein, partial [Muribaculaceae bacterium]|nr:RagB/SusD family nutrient uptake outer membrane protein [Muribaculaceae bacterium]